LTQKQRPRGSACLGVLASTRTAAIHIRSPAVLASSVTSHPQPPVTGDRTGQSDATDADLPSPQATT
jgi:hypothetical protein